MSLRHTEGVHPVFFYMPGDRLSLAELCAARLDGDVIELGEGFTPADSIDSAAWRAASITAVLPHRDAFAFVGPSAAWVHGAGDAAPNRHHVRRIAHRRLRFQSTPRLTVHDTVLDSEHLTQIAGVAVSSPGRTLFDLARAANRDPHCERWAWLLSEHAPDSVNDAMTHLEAWRGQPGVRRARELLQAMSTQTSVLTAL